MAAIPTFAEEDAKRPHRERETLRKWIGPLRHPLDKIGPIQGFSDACMTTLSARTSLALAAWLLTEGPALGLVVLGQVDDRL
jgi:hypothetical protein